MLRFLTALVLAVACLLAPLPAQALIEIDITEGQVRPLPTAVTRFFAAPDTDEARIGQDITEVIRSDLRSSGLFEIINPQAYIQQPDELRQVPRFADWRTINAQALLTGEVRPAEGGAIQVDFRLWDVFAGEQLQGFRFNAAAEEWRRVAHQIADRVYERLTGESGYFDTRIVYVAESGPPTARVKRLAIMDQDGANHGFLTDGGDLVLTPRFDPSGQNVAYMTYRQGQPRVYVRNLPSGQERLLGDFPSMTFAPRFDPTGRQVALSQAAGGNSDIFTVDLLTGARQRLTDDSAIDTSPSFSPDGERLVFNSDRGGSPQLYVMNADGSEQRRISFGSGSYGSPSWSPRGDLIAFTKIRGGRFFIGVMRPDGADERMLVEDYLVDTPSWAPNGRTVLFSRQRGGGAPSELYAIDISGYNERQVATPLAASNPNWSPPRN